MNIFNAQFWTLLLIGSFMVLIGGWILKKALAASLSKSLAEVIVYQNDLMFKKLDLYKDLYDSLSKSVDTLKEKYEGLELKTHLNREDINKLIDDIHNLK